MATTEPVSSERWAARVHSPENIMPRRKLARRFEPRYGVSQAMLETEATWLAREADDHAVHSTSDLRDYLAKFRKSIDEDEPDVRARVRRLSESHQLILRGLLARDFWYLVKLYQCYLCSLPAEAIVSPPSSPQTDEDEDAERLVPFSEWLFDPAKV
jgi:hypothetical protein